MQVTFDILEEFAAAQIITTGKNPAREALELFAIKACRTQHPNESQLRRMPSSETACKFIPSHFSLTARNQVRRTSRESTFAKRTLMAKPKIHK